MTNRKDLLVPAAKMTVSALKIVDKFDFNVAVDESAWFLRWIGKSKANHVIVEARCIFKTRQTDCLNCLLTP